MQVRLEQVENEYRKQIEQLYGHAVLTVPYVIELSVKLFQEVKIIGISNSDYPENDMLLYQYGNYNWGDDFGEYFSFDITRQFLDPNEDEPYQLSLELIYESAPFQGIDCYNCWSFEYSDIDSFIAHIKTTEGFHRAEQSKPKAYRLRFSQC